MRARVLVRLVTLCLLLGGWATPALAQFTTPIADVSAKSTNTNGFTTATINATGATLIVIHVSDNNTTYTLSDTEGNTYTPLAEHLIIQRSRLHYVVSPVVSATLAFTLTCTGCAASMYVQAWAGVDTADPFDLQDGNSAAGAASIPTTTFTPSQNGSLVITGLNSDTTSTISIDSGAVITDQEVSVGGQAVGGAMVYLVQTTAAALNLTWSWTGANNPNTSVAVFKPGSGGGGGSAAAPLLPLLGVGGPR